jgi:hydrogenase maturation protease
MEGKGLAIIGLGNPLREDDGVGPRVVKELALQGLPEGVTVIDGGTGGLDLLRLLEGWSRVVVVDAADIGDDPGCYAVFTPDEAHLAEAQDLYSFHHAGLPEALALARALERPLPPVVIFGVQPERVGWGEGLSAAVEAALPELVEAILKQVGEDYAQDLDN